ncbi:hypothetical protein F3Y22_tig00111277pilonHSYRG00016 [Hibiscus syriacus]|uniref:DUF4283 domain-containing protein n=1 Tax=Hibiscus syriacus TaxID=106335 RepID=A0A6A2YRJ5_HIBSY|nr:hypothetical protein F3Y22_tig00111277pilonHSYRG00016 [Hibiscus syriacus]
MNVGISQMDATEITMVDAGVTEPGDVTTRQSCPSLPNEGGPKSYAAMVMGASVDERSVDTAFLKYEVDLQKDDVYVDRKGPYSMIHFSDGVHDTIDSNMFRTIIVRLLGRKIRYRVLWNKIMTLWQLQGRFQLVDLENDYYLVRFEKEYDYMKALMEGPWMIFGSYLTVQPWNRSFNTADDYPSQVIIWVRVPGLPYRYYSKSLFRMIAAEIEKVIKIDFNTNAGERGKFAKLAVVVDLNKSLLPWIGIDGFVQRLKYKAYHTFAFVVESMANRRRGVISCLKVRLTLKRLLLRIKYSNRTWGDKIRTSMALDGCNEPQACGVSVADATDRVLNSVRGHVFGHVVFITVADITDAVADLPGSNTSVSIPNNNGGNVVMQFAPKTGENEATVTVQPLDQGVEVTWQYPFKMEVNKKSLRVKKQNPHKSPGRPLLSDWISSAMKLLDEVSASHLVNNSSAVCQPSVGEGAAVLVDEDSRPPTDGSVAPRGYFNALLKSEERSGGAQSRDGVNKGFVDFVFDNGLVDIGFRGPTFTWSRGSLQQRQDRCLTNDCWLDMFPDSTVLHLDHLGSWDSTMDVRHNLDTFPPILEHWNASTFGEIGSERERSWPDYGELIVRGAFPGIKEGDVNLLEAPITEEEIKSVVFEMRPSKALGVDGFNVFFNQQNWDIVGPSVIRFVQETLFWTYPARHQPHVISAYPEDTGAGEN